MWVNQEMKVTKDWKWRSLERKIKYDYKKRYKGLSASHYWLSKEMVSNGLEEAVN